MRKSKIKLLLIFIIMNIIAILSFFATNNNFCVIAAEDQKYFSELNPNKNIYCIEYGITFQPGNYYGIGRDSVANDIAYVLGNTNPSKYSYYDGTFRTDIRQNYLWDKINGASHKNDYGNMATDIEALSQEATIIENLNADSINIENKNEEYLSGNGEFVIPNEKGEYGPFIINYPSINGELVGKSFEILINGKTLKNIPESGKEFYLTEEDGIILGEKNKIEIKYSALQYTGYMNKYTLIRNMLLVVTCKNCEQTYNSTTTGYYDEDNELNLLSSLSICDYCGTRNSKKNIDAVLLTDGDPQDIAIVSVNSQSINLEKSIEFWAGRKLVIDLNKTDNAKLANALENIEFEVSISGDEKAFIKQEDNSRPKTTKITTDANGNSQITIIACSETITVTFTETDNKFYINNGPIVIDFTYNKASKTWIPTIENSVQLRDVVSIVQKGEWFEFELNIVNIAKIENLILTKLNKLISGEKLPGIEFQIVLKNATDMNNNSNLRVTTDANGNIRLGTLKVIDPNEDIVITITETNVPTSPNVNYKGLYGGGTATITIRHAKPGCNVNVIGASSDVINANYDLTQNIVTFEIYNEVTIDLSGEVWLDGQTGIKPVQEPNNKKDASEKRLENIKVVAKRVADNEIVDTKYTDTNGVYEFKDLPVSITGNVQYVIEFTYDGINYIAVEPHVGATNEDSDAQEVNRDVFNARFATIVKDKAIGTDGTVTNLTYSYDGTSAKLQTMDGIDVKPEFAMVATTEPTRYNENTKDIDLGLVKKDVDLAAFTDLYSATVSINGESKKYNYNDLSKLDGILTVSEVVKPSYNLYLYNSDYNYRINDYKGLGESKVYSGMNPAQNSEMSKTKEEDELNIELTYQILLNNQSATEAIVNSIAYYYDAKLELVTQIDDAELDGQVTIDGVTYNRLLIPIGQTFDDIVNQGVAEIVFKVGKDENNSVYLKDFKNWIEIISYSTKEGCIDIDSAPDNIEVQKTEDDTDDARGINIQMNTEDRTISGFVFEDQKKNDDAHGNGKYNKEEDRRPDD